MLLRVSFLLAIPLIYMEESFVVEDDIDRIERILYHAFIFLEHSWFWFQRDSAVFRRLTLEEFPMRKLMYILFQKQFDL